MANIKINPALTPKLKINRWLGHDLDLNALYYAQAANNTILDVTTEDISISAWVKVDVDSGLSHKMILAKEGADAIFYYFEIYDYKLRLSIRDTEGDQYNLFGNTDLRDNKWHYVSGVIDKSDASQCKLFLDGYEDGATAKTGTLGDIGSVSNSAKLTMGGDHNANYKFDGQIRDVKLYYAAGDHWTDAQILYQAQHPFDYSAAAGTLTDAWRCDEGSGLTLNGLVNNLTLSNALAWSTQAKLAIETGLVGWWKMDDNAATPTVIDYSGKGNHGTFTDATGDHHTSAHTTAGQIGTALTFDGTDDYVSAGSTGMSKKMGTLSMWAKVLSSSGSNVYLFGHSTQNDMSMNRMYIQQNALNYRVGIGGTGSIDTGEDFIIGDWTHLILIWNNGTYYAYKDGAQVKTGAYSSFDLIDIKLTIGARRDGLSAFNGLIDDVRIYNYARSAEQILQDYNRGLAGRE